MLSDYEPLIVVNEKISIVNDHTQYETNQIRTLFNSWINQTEKESEIRKDYCEICLTRGVSFQGHHIAGEKHDYRQNTTRLTGRGSWQVLWRHNVLVFATFPNISGPYQFPDPSCN